MADLPIQRNWKSDVPKEVHKKILQSQIQERRSEISKRKQVIEDYQLKEVPKEEAVIIMLERDIISLTEELKNLDAKDIK